MKQVIRIGLLGAGQVGQKHAKAIAKVTGARLVAVADLDESRAKRAASESNASYTTDYRQVLHMELDAVINCLPHNLHHTSSLLAAARGLHILLEKPMCTTLDEAKEVLAACEQNDVKLMIGYVHRFRQEMLEAKELIDSGRLGQVMIAVDNFCVRGGPDVPEWVWDKAKAGGGVLMYGGIHAVDRLRWFLGSEVRRVYAQVRTYSAPMDVENGVVACLEFENGTVASLVQNSPRYASLVGWHTQLFGSQGMLVVKSGESLEFSNDAVRFARTYDRYDHFERQMREFVTAIEQDREPWITAQHGLLSLAIVLAVYKSFETQRPVEVADLLGDGV
jgi:UDP-N-acetylglucosamine 3-dehydrogenase